MGAAEQWPESPIVGETPSKYPEYGRAQYMLEFMGTEATLYLDRARYELHPESGRVEPAEKDYGGGVRGADFSSIDGAELHIADWISCVRSRGKPRAPVEAGVAAVSGAHLGNLAYRRGEIAKWPQ